MPTFSEKSKLILLTCDPRLKLICNSAIRFVDFSVLVGRRGKEAQEDKVERGLSKTPWPGSKHNCAIMMPNVPAFAWPEDPHGLSRAVDVAPYPISFENREKNLRRWVFLAGVFAQVAFTNNINLRWGGDWDSDHDFTDQSFDDLGHFELRGFS